MGAIPFDIGLPFTAFPPVARQQLGYFLGKRINGLAENLPQALYHYTSAVNLRSIISTGILRAYNLGQMTDFTEGRHAASCMTAILDRAYITEKIPHKKELLGALQSQLTKIDLSNVFALSFTADGDEAGMWGLYAKQGTGFSFCIPMLKVLHLRAQFKGMFLKCYYSPQELEEFCTTSLAEILRIFSDDVEAGSNPDPTLYARMFLEDASWFAPSFKQEGRQDEKEWRFIFSRPPTEHKRDDSGRTYIELPISTEPGDARAIEAICAGPDCDYTTSILPLQELLYMTGHGPNYPIHISKTHAAGPNREPPKLSNKT